MPEGGYFVCVHTSKIIVPADYVFPLDILKLEKDFRLAWFLIRELGVASVPISGSSLTAILIRYQNDVCNLLRPARLDFYSIKNRSIAAEYLRFSICQRDEVLDLAKERLRGLRRFLQPA